MTRLLPWLLALLALPAAALGPLETNHPLVEEGTRLYGEGAFEPALEKYDAAARERPQDPRVQYDRGLALYKLGRHDDARAALERAVELDRDGSLAGRLHYTLGNVAYAAGKKREAISEYKKALVKDPSDEQARHNLEVVLRDVPPKSAPGPDGGPSDGGANTDGGAKSDGGRPDGGVDGGSDGGAVDGGQGDGGRDGGQGDGGRPSPGDGGQGDGGRGDGGQGDQDRPGDAGEPSDERGGSGGADAGDQGHDAGAEAPEARWSPDAGPDVSRKEAEQLLDSVKNSEKNMQLWRFRQKTSKSDPHAKDW